MYGGAIREDAPVYSIQIPVMAPWDTASDLVPHGADPTASSSRMNPRLIVRARLTYLRISGAISLRVSSLPASDSPRSSTNPRASFAACFPRFPSLPIHRRTRRNITLTRISRRTYRASVRPAPQFRRIRIYEASAIRLLEASPRVAWRPGRDYFVARWGYFEGLRFGNGVGRDRILHGAPLRFTVGFSSLRDFASLVVPTLRRISIGYWEGQP